jgi:anti-sigma regulatory factor (Ser/Thr protein kinase)
MQSRTSVPGEAAQLAALTRFLQDFCVTAELPSAAALPFEIALEEIFMNVVMHGSPAGRLARVDVSLALCDDDLTMAVVDDGPAFDPLSLPAPDVNAPLDARRPGGLGVYFVRQMMDAVSYKREGPRNQLRMSKRVIRAKAAPAGTKPG